MKKSKCYILLVGLIFGGITPCISQEPDTLVQNLINQVSDSLYTNSVQRLQDFYTRYQLSDSIGPAGEWIYDQFIEFGYTDVVFDSFTWTQPQCEMPHVGRNIIATKIGNGSSDSLVILGGHYDSINAMSLDPNYPAPGADDNGTGVAGVLEIARLLEPYSFEKTIVFACFAAEEVGLEGSSDYSVKLLIQGIPVRFSCIVDMVGYKSAYWIKKFIIDTEMDYVNDALRTAQMVWTYSLRLAPVIEFHFNASDHWPLGHRGPALLLMEGEGNPMGHTEWDVLDSLDIPYATEITKVALASVVDVAGFDLVGIESSDQEGKTLVPRALVLYQNHPNPFNPTTTISFDVPEERQHMKLTVYDLRGRHVKTLIDSEIEPGNHKVVWDGRNDSGARTPSGVYFYQLTHSGKSHTKKMILLK